ncbi:MAG: flagellar biosynthesis protein FlhF [Gammaproteobacteria bacterium]|nr:MAG: flagellar biosynthesis protein FlhF [Gammaproteobacteria bacterium]HDY83287.1 flagellar biosynthesis protein FlhF [Halieaceae bacterium]
MKIKRFLDRDSRSAMARVRVELGPDAVILSNKNIGDQVELMAAIDLDEAALASGSKLPSQAVGRLHPAPEVDGTTLIDLQRELGNLRSMIEGKLSQLSWQDMARRPSAQAALQARLARLGLSRTLCGLISDLLPVQTDLETYWDMALEMLSSRVLEMKEDSLINDGGIVALMGSTGVGKTTTIAKLAARFVLRYGSKQVALVTTDCYRIGGQEQLQTFANYLGIPMAVATKSSELRSVLDQLTPRKLILIDTAGMSQRDLRLYDQFTTLNSVGYDIDTYVVLPATAQARTLREVVNVFGEGALAGAMITKVDESVGLGGVLDVVVESRLKLAYVSHGQKVPEDLTPARAASIIAKAVELTSQDVVNPTGGFQHIQSANLTTARN